MPALHVEIRGRVQGVGFRWFVRDIAQSKGIVGWVMNRDDGCVEVAAAGGAEELKEFLSDLRTGPTGAHVTAIRELPLLPEVELGNSFRMPR